MAIFGPLLNGVARDMILDYLKLTINPELQSPDNQDPTINLQPIPTDSFYISEKYEALKPPACYLVHNGPMKILYSNEPNWLNGEDPFMAIISAQDIDATVLQRKSEHYARILYKLLDQKDLLKIEDGKVRMKLHCVTEEVEYSDILAQKLGTTGEIYRRDCIVRFKAMHFEARTLSTT